MMTDNITALGELHVVLTDENGHIKQDFYTPNLVVSSGKNLIASRLVDASAAVMTSMAIGTGAVAPAIENTTLQTEIGRSVGALTTSLAGNVVSYSATFPAGTGTGAIVEAGIFNASTNGTMLSRTAFSPVNKTSSDILTINWTITIN